MHVRDITLRDAACWMENYFNCDRVLLENITMRSQVNYNNDGIDIDGCRDVIVRNCDVRSGDDALCFKAASERPTERVLVENCSLLSSCNALKVGTDTQSDFRDILVRSCLIGGVSEDPNGIKHPCCDSAVSLETVDGGTLESILITGCRIERAWSPFFMRLEDRGRVREGLPRPGIGTLRHIVIEHITGSDCGPRGSYPVDSWRSLVCLHPLVCPVHVVLVQDRLKQFPASACRFSVFWSDSTLHSHISFAFRAISLRAAAVPGVFYLFHAVLLPPVTPACIGSALPLSFFPPRYYGFG